MGSVQKEGENGVCQDDDGHKITHLCRSNKDRKTTIVITSKTTPQSIPSLPQFFFLSFSSLSSDAPPIIFSHHSFIHNISDVNLIKFSKGACRLHRPDGVESAQRPGAAVPLPPRSPLQEDELPPELFLERESFPRLPPRPAHCSGRRKSMDHPFSIIGFMQRRIGEKRARLYSDGYGGYE